MGNNSSSAKKPPSTHLAPSEISDGAGAGDNLHSPSPSTDSSSSKMMGNNGHACSSVVEGDENNTTQTDDNDKISSPYNVMMNLKERIDPKNMDKETKEKVKAGLFLGTLTGLSMLSGFGMTLAVSKRQDPNNFAKGLSGSREIPESGISLASRALARGTLCSVVGVGLICFTVWKMLGVHSLSEFRQKVGTMMPTIPKKENPGRGDFRTIRDLFQFIIDEDEREKREQQQSTKPS